MKIPGTGNSRYRYVTLWFPAHLIFSEWWHLGGGGLVKLTIAFLGGNPEVGNSEYMDHQNYKHIFLSAYLRLHLGDIYVIH